MRNVCKVEGCDHVVESREEMLCKKHYRRFLKYGSTELPKRPTECRICGGKIRSFDLCAKHYQMFWVYGDPEYSDKRRAALRKNGYVKGKEKYKYRHREIAEKMLGRELTKSDKVHHIDLDKTNNNEENLYVCTTKEHSTLHIQLQYVASEFIKLGIIQFIDNKYVNKFDEFLENLKKFLEE